MAYRWSTYSQQYKISLNLAYPVVIGQLGQIMVSVADSIMVGNSSEPFHLPRLALPYRC